jgi:ethanolamine utilization microcompartment shell protein EutS
MKRYPAAIAVLLAGPAADGCDAAWAAITASPGAAQMSATAFAVKEADLTIRSHGLCEWYLFRHFGRIELMDGDVEAYVAELKRDVIEGLGQLPQATFSDATRQALTKLIHELPNPAGVMTLSLRADTGFGPARVMGFSISGPPASIADVAPIFDGVTIEVGWTHEDRP